MAAPMENLIEKYLCGNPVEAAVSIASDIKKDGSKFINFIEDLGSYLTSTDNVSRGRATHMIGDVLDLLPTSYLSQEQSDLVTTFLLAKLSDHHSVQPHALQSLAVLTTKCSPLKDETVQQICQTIFQEIQNQSLSHADRRATYTILQNLLGSSTSVLQSMGGDFVIGFIQMIDSEKDPRNLLICFNCAYFVCSSFSLGAFKEEMFEVLGCYFPIDFVPPPNDSHGITKEELVLSLRKCFAATSDFAEFCMPLLLEKITSDLQSARLDAFLTLALCAPVYGARGVGPFLGSINSTVKREVLMGISPELVDAACTAIKSVYTAVTVSPSDKVIHSSDPSENIVELYQDLSKFLEGSDTKKSCLGYSLCRSVAESSLQAQAVILPLVLPSLINWCQKPLQILEQLAFVQELNEFIILLQKKEVSCKDFPPSLKEATAKLPEVLEQMLNKATSLQLEAVKGLTLIATSNLAEACPTRDRLIPVLVGKAVDLQESDLRKQVLQSLHTLLEKDTSIAEKTISSTIQHANKENFQLATDALVHTVIDTATFTQVNGHFLQRMSQSLSDCQISQEKSGILLSCAKSIVDLLKSFARLDAFSTVVVSTAYPLVCMAVRASLHLEIKEETNVYQKFISFLRDAFSVLGQCLSKSDTTTLWNKLALLFVNGDIQDLDISIDSKMFQPMQVSSPSQQTQLIALLEGFLTGADIQACIDQRDKVLECSFTLALASNDEFTHLSACHCVASIFNKAPIGSEIHWFLEPIVDKMRVAMNPDNLFDGRLRSLNLWMWLSKAMECRGHSTTSLLSSHLVNLLSDDDLGPEVGRRLSMVVQDMDDIFSSRLHSNVTPLYKQRFFAMNLKGLLNGYHNAPHKSIEQNHLLGLSGIVSELPLQVTSPHLATLLPLLMLALSNGDNPNLPALLTTLSAAIKSSPQAVVSNIDSLVSQLLDLSIKSLMMKVRIAALSCLEQVTCLPSHMLVPCQNRVVRELLNAVGDKKRLVRRQAAETRSAWILLETEKK